MKSYRKGNPILEELAGNPFERITPKKYSRAYMEKGGPRSTGYLMKVTDTDGTFKVFKEIFVNSNTVKKIKEEWEPAIVMSGGELAGYLVPEEIRLYKVNTSYETVYKINDESIIKKKTDSWDYWLERVETYEDHLPKGSVDQMKGIMDVL